MNRLLYIAAISSFLVLSAGCHKEQNSEPAPQITETATAPVVNENKPVADSVVTVPEEHPEDKQDESFEANFASNDFPEIHTTVCKMEKPWGYVQRTTLHWHKDIKIYNDIPVFKDDGPAYKKINEIMAEKNRRFFTNFYKGES